MRLGGVARCGHRCHELPEKARGYLAESHLETRFGNNASKVWKLQRGGVDDPKHTLGDRILRYLVGYGKIRSSKRLECVGRQRRTQTLLEGNDDPRVLSRTCRSPATLHL